MHAVPFSELHRYVLEKEKETAHSQSRRRANVFSWWVWGGGWGGVCGTGGEKIFAKLGVISGAGVFNTYKKLLPEESIPPAIRPHFAQARAKIEKIGHSCSFVYLFVGMEGTAAELELRSSNIWVWPDRDYDAMIDAFYADPEKVHSLHRARTIGASAFFLFFQ